MPSVTLTTDTANTAKIQAVVDYYNTANATTLTIKQWMVLMLSNAYKQWNGERLDSTVATGKGDQIVVT